MHLRLIITAVLLLSALGWWYLSKPESSTTQAADTALVMEPSSLPPETHNTQQQAKQQPNQSKTNQASWKERWLEQLSERRYSEDLLVELMSLGLEYETCGNRNQSWRFQGKTLSEAQDQIRKAVEKHCEDLFNAYPLLEDQSLQNGMQELFLLLTPSTPLGQFFLDQAINRQALDMGDFLSTLVPLALEAQNAQMLVMANIMVTYRQNHVSIESQLLKSIDPKYVGFVRSIALTQLSCQFQGGLTCSPTGHFMQDKCFVDDRFCGMNFDQWFTLAVTPGIQQDVQLLAQYFTALATP